jgi:hypothetical protein
MNWRAQLVVVLKERDELRAKLAEAETECNEWAAFESAANERTLGAWDCEKEQRKRAEAAEAVAEERRDRAKKAELALEAAEARARELEATLERMGVYDPS